MAGGVMLIPELADREVVENIMPKPKLEELKQLDGVACTNSGS